jgi:hypothetical protein
MNLNEMFEPAIPGMQDVQDDNSQPDFEEYTRKTRLTLKQINKLRSMLDLRNVEYKDNLKDIQRQYAAPAAEAMPPM